MSEWAQFYFPTQLQFERDSIHKMGTHLKEVGDRFLLLAIQSEITNPDALEQLRSSIASNSKGVILYDDIHARPNLSDIESAVSFARQSKCNAIVAFGSKETYNLARIVSLLAPNEVFAADLSDTTYPYRISPLPIVNIPASPSMGEEVSPQILIYDRSSNFYYQQVDSRLFPRMLLVDPKITETLAESELASSGMAALCVAIESILSARSNEITSTLALKAIELVERNLTTLLHGSGGVNVRNNVSLASVLSGMSHSVTHFGANYAIASALSHISSIDFYVSLAMLLPHVMEYNMTNAAAKFIPIARALQREQREMTIIEASIYSVDTVRKMAQSLNIPLRIADFDVNKALLRNVAELASRSFFIKNTPRPLNTSEIEVILMAAY